MSSTDDPRQNHLLSALPAGDREWLFPHLERVHLRPGESLYEHGCQLQYVYFPTTAIVSLLYIMENGAPAEITGVGNEGMLGVTLFMGGGTMPYRAMVLCAGAAYRLKSQVLIEQFNRTGGRRSGALQHLMLRYTQIMITQISQTAACNRHHSIGQKLCRWLLENLDRLPSCELSLTHELIANMLGVRRESITEAAGKLQDSRYICYRHGHITVLDRAGLEKQACECYQTVKTEVDRLLPEAATTQSV
ncbi:MAG: Crp/Fnr family transcriptional regulator [Sedimenticola sp.]|nr:Crp/Fnr family transcriptional regulator [Sedimenticola sp.]